MELRAAHGAPRRFCGARTRSGGKCKRRAGFGTDHVGYGNCKSHGGSTPSGRQAAAREELAGFMASAAPLMDADPIEALLYCVRRASGMAAWLRLKCQGVEDAQELKDGELNVWGRLESEALDRLARFSKMALDAGVAERRVRLAEQVGALIAQAMEQALAEEGLPPAVQARVAQRVATHLAVLEQAPPDQEAA